MPDRHPRCTHWFILLLPGSVCEYRAGGGERACGFLCAEEKHEKRKAEQLVVVLGAGPHSGRREESQKGNFRCLKLISDPR